MKWSVYSTKAFYTTYYYIIWYTVKWIIKGLTIELFYCYSPRTHRPYKVCIHTKYTHAHTDTHTSFVYYMKVEWWQRFGENISDQFRILGIFSWSSLFICVLKMGVRLLIHRLFYFVWKIFTNTFAEFFFIFYSWLVIFILNWLFSINPRSCRATTFT